VFLYRLGKRRGGSGKTDQSFVVIRDGEGEKKKRDGQNEAKE